MPVVRPFSQLPDAMSLNRSMQVLVLIFLAFLSTFGRVGMAQPLRVGVSIPPQAYFLEQIAGDLVEVSVALQKGSDPHTFSPTAAQMNELSQASLFFKAGLASEQHWAAKLATILPSIKWVKPVAEHADAHFWLSPVAVMANISIMSDALSKADPGNQDIYTENTERFMQILDKLHSELQQLFAGLGVQNRFLVLHDAWDVMASEYGLQQIVIEQEGKSVSVRHLAGLVSIASRLGIDTVFADIGHSTKQAKVIARQIDAEVQVLDPLGRDWQNNLLAAATAIKAGLR